MGTVVQGKMQSGTLSKGQTALLMPNKVKVVIDSIQSDDTGMDCCVHDKCNYTSVSAFMMSEWLDDWLFYVVGGGFFLCIFKQHNVLLRFHSIH